MRYQLELLLTAVQFLTRLPVPNSLPYSEERLRQSAAYFPLVGYLVGALAAGCILALPAHWHLVTRLLVSSAVTLWVTGAFHEDGFADACDGFGGGWKRDRVLEIMKDSRLGTYGVSGFVFAAGLKIAMLSEMSPDRIPAMLMLGHGYSRFLALTLAYQGRYAGDVVRDKPTAQGISWATLRLAAAFTLVPLLFGGAPLASVLLPVLARIWLGQYFTRRIGGYTGDCLGALQVVCEVLFYAGASARV